MNALSGDEREDLRAYVIGLLQEEIHDAEPLGGEVPGQAVGTFNPLGIGIPVLLMGSILIVVFPPVGLLLLLVAALLVVWGIGTTLVGGRVTRKR